MYKIVNVSKTIKIKEEYIKNNKIQSNSTFEIGNNIKRYRQELGLTQLELANMVGITRQTLAVIERGEQIPTILISYLLSRVLNVEEDSLFNIKERSG